MTKKSSTGNGGCKNHIYLKLNKSVAPTVAIYTLSSRSVIWQHRPKRPQKICVSAVTKEKNSPLSSIYYILYISIILYIYI